MRKKTAKSYTPRNVGPDHFIFKGFFSHIPRREYTLQKHALASKLGLTPRDLDRLVCGQEQPDEEQLLTIARHFKLALDDLFVFPSAGPPPLVQEIQKAVHAQKERPTTEESSEAAAPALPTPALPVVPPRKEAETPAKRSTERKTKSKKKPTPPSNIV